MAIGLTTIYSASQSLAAASDPADLAAWFTGHRPTTGMDTQALRQFLFVPLGFACMLLFNRLDYSFWRIRTRWLMSPTVWLWAAALAGLLLVFVPGVGVSVNGAHRWIRPLPGVNVQPSELAKIILPFVLAAVLASPQIDIKKFWRGLVPVCLLIAMTAGLVGIEDLGTAVLLATVSGMLLILGGARLIHLMFFGGLGAAAVVGLIILEPYRMARLISFQDIWADPQGKGYHPIQSLITIAEGGLWGTGLGGSIQKLGYLPESRTDFVFSVLASELGLLGATGVIALFIAFIWTGRRIYRAAPDLHGRLLAFGITMTIGLQALMNIAVVTVSAPTKGISLPLVSAGGSGVLFFALAIGTLANIGRARTVRSSASALPGNPSNPGQRSA